MSEELMWRGKDVGALLTLEQLDRDLYRNRLNQTNSNDTLFGGQVLAQGLMAATMSVDEARYAHSLHGYFLRAGDGNRPVIYQVERTRDGGRFSTRRVTAIQHGEAILHLECSFHVPEDGFDHQENMPATTPPSEVAEIGELVDDPESAEMVTWLRHRLAADITPIEIRPVPASAETANSGAGQQKVWMRIHEDMADSIALHTCFLTYLSDYYLAGTATLPHAKRTQQEMFIASLDHALWFHRPIRVDQWLLFDFESPSASNGRGFARGSIFNEKGELVASLAQEALLRRGRR